MLPPFYWEIGENGGVSMRNVIQVFVVCLILAVIGGVFFVFVVKVRETAQRMQCQNNLKQLALTLSLYHDTCRKFPQAALSNPDLPPERRQSWLVEIWPYIEASPFYNKMDHEKAWDAEHNKIVL